MASRTMTNNGFIRMERALLDALMVVDGNLMAVQLELMMVWLRFDRGQKGSSLVAQGKMTL